MRVGSLIALDAAPGEMTCELASFQHAAVSYSTVTYVQAISRQVQSTKLLMMYQM